MGPAGFRVRAWMVLCLGASLSGAVATALAGEGSAPSPPKDPPRHGPIPPGPGFAGPGEVPEKEWAPEAGEWTDTGGEVPAQWGWGSKVILSWSRPEIDVTPLDAGRVRIRMENRGSETARIPMALLRIPNGKWDIDVTFEGRVENTEEWGITICFPPPDTVPLLPGDVLQWNAGLAWSLRSRLQGCHLVSVSTPLEGTKGGPVRRLRVLPPLKVHMHPATDAELARVVAKIAKRSSWRDLSEEDIAVWGDMGDARLLPPLAGVLMEMAALEGRGSREAAEASRWIRVAMAKTRVLLALDAKKDDEVRAFLAANQPDDRGLGHFKAMLRARMDKLRKGR